MVNQIQLRPNPLAKWQDALVGSQPGQNRFGPNPKAEPAAVPTGEMGNLAPPLLPDKPSSLVRRSALTPDLIPRKGRPLPLGGSRKLASPVPSEE